MLHEYHIYSIWYYPQFHRNVLPADTGALLCVYIYIYIYTYLRTTLLSVPDNSTTTMDILKTITKIKTHRKINQSTFLSPTQLLY